MPRKALMNRDPERGERFAEICRLLFPGLNRSEIADRLGGVSPGTVRNWEIGQGLSRPILSRLEHMGVSLDYLLNGTGRPLASASGESPESAPAPELSPAEALAANMRHLRKERFRGWGGQRRFAEFLGISANDLCVYEYGRALPNEQRLEDMAARLDLRPEELLRLLPGAEPASRPPRATADIAKAVLRNGERDDGGEEASRREIARLEAMNEVLREQLAAREGRIRELEEANLALRGIVYSENTPDGAERRRRLLEKIEASLAGVNGEGGVF